MDRLGSSHFHPLANRLRRVGRRIACILAALLLPCAASAQSPLDRPARLAVEGMALPDALRLLQQTAAVPLVFSPDRLPKERRVNCACAERTVGEALELLLAGSGLTFRVSGSRVLIVPIGSGVVGRGVVTGTVVDAETQASVGGVVVRLETGRGVLADASGGFVLRDVAAGAHRVEVTGIGWEPWSSGEVVVGAGDTVSVAVRLRRSAVPLPEIVVAPGTFGMLESTPPVSVRTITREEIEAMPQVGEDVFRSLTRLPGVTAHDISTRLSVRGSLDREVMVRLDGLELYEPYHLKDFDGALGIMDLTALAGVELKAGGFGVEYGDRAAGVLDMKSRTGVGPALTTAGLNISHLALQSQGGFAGDRGSWLVSGRGGSLGLLMKMVNADDRISPQFYDVFGKVSYQPSPSQLLSVHLLHAGDRLHLDLGKWDGLTVTGEIEQGRIRTDWGNSYLWATWDVKRGMLESRTLLSAARLTRFREGYQDDLGSIGTPEQIAVRDDRSFLSRGLRQEVELELASDVLLRAGVEAIRTTASYDYHADTRTPYVTGDGLARLHADTMDVSLDPGGWRTSGFLAVRARAGERVTAERGGRDDRVSQTDEALLSPRAQASLGLGAGLTLQVSAGRYHQSQGIGELQVGDGQTLYAPAERSDLFAIGLQRRFGSSVGLRLEAYARRISDQQPRFVGLEQDLAVFPEQQGDRARVDPGRGRARGWELIAEGSRGTRWSWSASYALAQAKDEIPQAGSCSEGPTCLEDPWVPRPRDQRHTVNVQAVLRPGSAWELAASWIYHSGWPFTEWSYAVTPLANGSLFWGRTFGPLNGGRLPAYHRLDLRVTRAFRMPRGTMEAYLDLFNVYDRRNKASVQYAGRLDVGNRVTMVRTDGGEEMLPFLPMFGLRWRF
ncbi:MAG: TonB-dependent receptor [Gemmatimonadetes bacterium]|nr:TonB-dependent receptor [Gemmatimonadota bacterium]